MPDQRRRPLREHHRHKRHVELRLACVRAVVQADREDLARLRGMEELNVRDLVHLAVGGLDRGPALVVGDEALRPRGAGVDDDAVVETADVSRARGGGIADCLHSSASCSARSTFIALTARGTPAYGVICRIVSSISRHGTSIARSARMWACTCGSLDPRVASTATMMSSRSRAGSPGRVWTSPNAKSTIQSP